MELLKLSEMTVEQKIGMLFVVRGFRNEDDRAFIFDMLKKKAVGGIQVTCREGCDEEIRQINEAAGYPVLICADMETGFPLSDNHIPAMMSLAATNDEEMAYQFGCITAIEAKRMGYNTVWGPNVDLIMGDSLCCVPRVFGTDPQRTARLSAAVARGYAENGMCFTAKHFPGGRDVTVDTHMMEGCSMHTEEDIRSVDLIPYLEIMNTCGLAGVMTKHTVYPKIDPEYPATLSKPLIDILRSTGFDGVIMTDSFAMMGILQKYGEENIYGQAVAAGNDMVLPNYRITFREAYNYMMKSYENGVITPERLDEAVRRVLAAQALTCKPAASKELSAEQATLSHRIAEKSICAITDEGTDVALAPDKKRLFVVMQENLYREEGGEDYEISVPGAVVEADLPAIRQEIENYFPGSTVMAISQYPNYRQIEKVCYASTKADEVIFLTYTLTGAYRASEAFSDKMIRIMESMQQRIAAIAHVGNPYAMVDTPHSPRRLFAFGGSDNIPQFLRILAGKAKAEGSLPVSLDLK